MRTITVVPDAALHRDLVTALGKYPEIELVRHLASYPEPDDFLRILRARSPNFVFISLQDCLRFEALAGAVDASMPGVPVIAVGHDSAPVELMSKLMLLGVRHLISLPITPEKIGETIASVAWQLDRHPASLIRLADLYAFFPAKPGVGSSTITVSTSCALANQLHARTLLLDCDLTAGITKFLLKLGNSSSIVNALEHADSLDEDLWSQMVGHWDGLEILHAGELDPPASLTAASLEVVLGFARAQYDTICADLASSLDSFTLQVMHEARRVFMVTTPELVPLHMAADRLRHFKELGLSDKVSLLLNRTNPPHQGLSDEEAGELVGMPVSHHFSNDYLGVQGAILNAVPLSYRSNLGRNIMALARSLAPASTRPDLPAHHRRFLEFFHIPSWRDHETVWRG